MQLNSTESSELSPVISALNFVRTVQACSRTTEYDEPDLEDDTLNFRVNYQRGLDEDWSFETAGLCFPVPRRDASFWFALTGREAAAMLAKLCGVGLRPKRFADRSVAQTSVARMSAIVIRNDLGGTLAPSRRTNHHSLTMLTFPRATNADIA